MSNQTNKIALAPRNDIAVPDGIKYFRMPLHETSGIAAAWETETSSGSINISGTAAAPFATPGCATLDGNSWWALGTTVTGLYDVATSESAEAVHQLFLARLYYTANPASDNVIFALGSHGVEGLMWLLSSGGELKCGYTAAGGSGVLRVNSPASAKNAWITIGLHLDHETGNLTHYSSASATLTQTYTTGEINLNNLRGAMFGRLSLDGTAEDTTYGQAFGTAAGTLISDFTALRLPAGTTAADIAAIVTEYDQLAGRDLPRRTLNRIYGA